MDTKKKWERTRPACGFRRLAEPKRGGFSLSSQKRRRGTGRGGRFSSVCPSLQLSPRSFLAGREGKKPSAFLCRTLGASRHVDLYPIKGEPFRIRTSIPPGWLQTQRIDVPPSRSAQRNTIRGVGEILLPVPPGQDARQAGRLPLQPKLFPIL